MKNLDVWLAIGGALASLLVIIVRRPHGWGAARGFFLSATLGIAVYAATSLYFLTTGDEVETSIAKSIFCPVFPQMKACEGEKTGSLFWSRYTDDNGTISLISRLVLREANFNTEIIYSIENGAAVANIHFYTAVDGQFRAASAVDIVEGIGVQRGSEDAEVNWLYGRVTALGGARFRYVFENPPTAIRDALVSASRVGLLYLTLDTTRQFVLFEKTSVESQAVVAAVFDDMIAQLPP